MTDSRVNLHGASDDEDRHASNLSNDQLEKEFHEYVGENVKQSTSDFYETNFTPFKRWVTDRNGHLTDDVNARDIENFLQSQADKYAPKTVGHRLSAISRFYNVLRKINLLEPDDVLPSEYVDRDNVAGLSKKTVSEVTAGESFHYLKADEVTKLIDNVPAPELRNRTLVMLMANTGLRASEVIRVKVNQLDLGNKELTVLSPKQSDDNENDPERITVYWRSQTLSQTLDTYIEFDRPSYAYASESAYLFPSAQSERLSYQTVNRVVKQAAENAGLQGDKNTDGQGNERKDVTSHVLRHSYAMAALDNGMSIDEIRDNLHHSDISVTMKYLRRHEEERKQAVEKHGPQFGSPE